MIASILNIGDELLIGQVINSNASWISAELNKIGIQVWRVFTIGDNESEIISSLNYILPYSDLVFITGGLGPTKDDITKKVLTKYFGSEMIFHEASYKNIERILLNRLGKINEINRSQAFVPSSAKILINRFGTAPIMWFTVNNKNVISLPGMPFEMQEVMK